MPDEPFELKPWLDVHVVPLLRPEPALELHSVLLNQPAGAARPEAVLVWALAKTGPGWAPAVKRLLDGGLLFDYTRAPQLITVAPGKTLTLFGGDGMPFIGANGMAMVRLYRRSQDGIEMICEIGHRFPSGPAAVAAVRELFQHFGQDGSDFLTRLTPRFGEA